MITFARQGTRLLVVREITRINSMNTYNFLTKLGMYKRSILNIFDLEKKGTWRRIKNNSQFPQKKLTIWLEKKTEKCCHDIKQEL